MENQTLLTLPELAAVLKVPNSWIYDKTRRRDLAFPTIRVGKYCRFNIDQVMSWIKTRQEAPR